MPGRKKEKKQRNFMMEGTLAHRRFDSHTGWDVSRLRISVSRFSGVGKRLNLRLVFLEGLSYHAGVSVAKLSVKVNK